MYHKVIIIGNLGNDPELRYSPTGEPVVNFSVAANRRWTNQNGSPGEETVWFRCTAWRKLAETINQYLSKGRQVYIEGRLTPDRNTGGPRVWVGSDGQARASYEVTVETVKFLGGRGEAIEPSIDETEPISSSELDELTF
jgi:single-strand DNA-binding protein